MDRSNQVKRLEREQGAYFQALLACEPWEQDGPWFGGGDRLRKLSRGLIIVSRKLARARGKAKTKTQG